MRQVVYDIFAGRPGVREGLVWPEQSIWTAWETAVERDELDDWHVHDCRHHFVSWFMTRGGNLLVPSKILGHAKVSMTESYAHLAPTTCAGKSPGLSASWRQFLEPQEQHTSGTHRRW